ncbi:MAG: diguanylate cyclase [Sporomusaceae bacterium]|nr:diguanylate cyclase [Sporomusaceae bacterium]
MRMNSLKTKIAVSVSLLVVLLATLTSSYILSYFEATFKKTIAEQEFTLISGMAQEIDNKLETVHNALIAVSKSIDPVLLADPDKAQAYLDSKAGLNSLFDNHIFFFSPAGNIIAESPFEPGRRGLSFAHREYIQKTLELGKPYIGEPYISSQSHGHPAIMLTAPIYDADGKLVGIIAGGLDLIKDNFLGTLTRTKLGQTGFLYLYDTNRTMIIHPDTERTLKRDVPPGVNNLFDQAIKGFEGSEETISSRGVHHLATFKHLTKTNWILAAHHPIREVYDPIIKARQYFVIALVAGVLLILIGIWFIVGNFTAPLVAFTRHVEKVGGNQGERRFSAIFPNDEIGALSTAFNKMLSELDGKAASLEKSEELYRTITEFASDMVFWRGPAGEMFYISPNCERVTGYQDCDFYAHPRLLDDIVYFGDMARWQAYTGRLGDTASGSLEFRIVTKEGSVRWINCVTRQVFNDKGEFLGFRGSHQDITDRKRAEEQLHFVSLHDYLTGFRNRASFEKDLDFFAHSGCLPVSLVVCDVDGLKFVNDTLGHNAGDELLIKVAAILKEHFSADAAIYRFGGDEFIAILPVTDQETVAKLCHGLRSAIVRHNDDSEMPISVSIGYATGASANIDMATLFKEADDNMYREKLNHNLNARSTTLAALTKAMEARDSFTADNAARMERLIALFGEKVGLSEKARNDLQLLAKFHDVGKVGIDDSILLNPGPLTAQERIMMQRHVEIGYRIAISTPNLAPVAELILKHHEWWNGEGYPLQLQGDKIPLECRVFAIVDAYDAMVSDRPYRAAMTHTQALAEIKRCAGAQFDPYLAEVFVAAMAVRETDE